MPASALKTGKNPTKQKMSAPKLKPTEVLAYLQANPTFFEKHKEKLGALAVPKKGGNILSLHALKADKLAKQAQTLEIRQKQLISMAKANALVAETVFATVLSLIGCRTLANLRKYLQTEFQGQLALQSTRLFLADDSTGEESANTLTTHQIAALCPQTIVLAPLDAGAHRPLFGPKTNSLKSVCLMALTETDGTYIGLLAMGSTDETRFHAGQATTLAEFLRQAAGLTLHHAICQGSR